MNSLLDILDGLRGVLPLSPWKLAGVGAIATFHWYCCWRERRTLPPPGQMIDLGVGVSRGVSRGISQRIEHRDNWKNQPGLKLHAWMSGPASPPQTEKPTIVLDHSLGGVEGYLLQDKLTQRSQLWVWDRAGYGWSGSSSAPRTSATIVAELDQALQLTGVEPPYLLVGDSFGSYNLRLYAHRFPENVVGLVLTDGLHEAGMLALPWEMKLLKAFFGLSFAIAALGARLGLVRLCGVLGLFELLKPELRQFTPIARAYVKRSFYRSSHWWTMAREIWGLDRSGQQLQTATDLGELPIVSIKASTFLAPRFGPLRLPLHSADRVRDRIHPCLLQLSRHTHPLQAPQSGHFVWVDQPDVILEAIDYLLQGPLKG